MTKMWLEKKISKIKQSNILCPKLRLYVTGWCAQLIEMCSYLKDDQILESLQWNRTLARTMLLEFLRQDLWVDVMGDDTNVRIPGSEENWRPSWRLAKTECFFRCSFSTMSMVRGGACMSEDKV